MLNFLGRLVACTSGVRRGCECAPTDLPALSASFIACDPDPTTAYRRAMDPMPVPGDLITAFSPQPGRCCRMVYSHQLQAAHCSGAPAWMGRWRDVKVCTWYVEACREHAPKAASEASEGC
jgi:hypothetical protein